MQNVVSYIFLTMKSKEILNSFTLKKWRHFNLLIVLLAFAEIRHHGERDNANGEAFHVNYNSLNFMFGISRIPFSYNFRLFSGRQLDFIYLLEQLFCVILYFLFPHLSLKVLSFLLRGIRLVAGKCECAFCF